MDKRLRNVTFCDFLHEQNKKRKQTFESEQHELKISLKLGLMSRFQSVTQGYRTFTLRGFIFQRYFYEKRLLCFVTNTLHQ